MQPYSVAVIHTTYMFFTLEYGYDFYKATKT